MDILADNQTSTIGHHIDRHLTNQYNRYVGQYIERHMGHLSVNNYIVIDRYVNRVLVDMSTEGCTNYTRSRNCRSVSK